MKSLLARIGLPTAVGLSIEEDAVNLSHVVATPWGPVEVARHREQGCREDVGAALKRLTGRMGASGSLRRMPVAIGLPASRLYFSTRPVQETSRNPSPHVLLREALRSTSVSTNNMVADVILSQPDKRSVASIVACDKEYLDTLLGVLGECGAWPQRVEPTPCALLRTAALHYRAPRNAKVVLRVFLAETHGLAMLAASNSPIIWRSFELRRGDEALTILSIGRALLTMSQACGVDSQLDAVMLHGRTDLTRLVDVGWMENQIGASISWHEQPAWDGQQAAFGLAAGCFNDRTPAFDLAKNLKSEATLREIFPWREVVALAAVLLCMAVLLLDRWHALDERLTEVRSKNQQRQWLAATQPQELERERNELKQKVSATKEFLESRIIWASYQQGLAACLPDNVILTSFQGDCQLKTAGKGKNSKGPKKSLVLRGAVTVPPDGSIPREIDRFLDTLRQHPLIVRDFPVVTLAALKQLQQPGGGSPQAVFTVICSPKSATRAAGAS